MSWNVKGLKKNDVFLKRFNCVQLYTSPGKIGTESTKLLNHNRIEERILNHKRIGVKKVKRKMEKRNKEHKFISLKIKIKIIYLQCKMLLIL